MIQGIKDRSEIREGKVIKKQGCRDEGETRKGNQGKTQRWVSMGRREDLGKIQGVMVEGPPTSFSPFSLVDCTMLSHFSFNDFIAIAFLDLAGDLDI